VHSLVSTLQSAGHTVSVCLPNTQRSWIGKAHLVGRSIRPTYFRPGTLHKDDGVVSNRPLPPGSKQEEWILVDSTPASCVQVGLFHYFEERGPIDLVVSGPNYGRNTTAIFALSSGTIGGAMEAATCGLKAIALSYAFFDRNHDPEIIAGASKMSVRVIEYLAKNWDKSENAPHLYSVNVPLVKHVETTKVLWTQMLQNRWKSGSLMQAIEVPEEEDASPEEDEAKIREDENQEETSAAGGLAEETGQYDGTEQEPQKHLRYRHKHFKWAPMFKDVHESVDEAPPGNDGWAVKEGYVRY